MRWRSILWGFGLALMPGLAGAQVTVFEKTNPDDPEDTRSLQLYGFIQPRFAHQQKDLRSANKVDNSPGFSLQRSRLGTIARVDKIATLVAEFELTTTAVLGIDAFGRLHPIPELQLTLGQFRVPFSRQNLIQGFTHQLPDTAYFVAPKFVVDRDIGGQLSGEFLDGRLSYALAMMNGNGPRQEKNLDDYFLYAARVTVSPLGRFPRFESDVRSDADRKKLLFYVAGGGMHNHLKQSKLTYRYVGADAALLYEGFSFYGEFYYRKDTPEDDAARRESVVEAEAVGFNVQAGYFPPLPYARDHIEVAARLQQFDPSTKNKEPTRGDDLTSSNPSQGFRGVGLGLNWFAHRGHAAKIQAYYDIRSELKKCMAGDRSQTNPPSDLYCTGYVKNNLFVLQATVAF